MRIRIRIRIMVPVPVPVVVMVMVVLVVLALVVVEVQVQVRMQGIILLKGKRGMQPEFILDILLRANLPTPAIPMSTPTPTPMHRPKIQIHSQYSA